MEILGFLIGLCLAGYFYFKWYTLKKEKQEIVQLNEAKRIENKELEIEYKKLLYLKQQEERQYDDLITRIDSLTKAAYEKADKDATEKMKYRLLELDKLYSDKTQELDAQYQKYYENLEAEYCEVLQDLSSYSFDKIKAAKEIEDQLVELKAKQTSYINEKLRQEAIQSQKDFYKMTLPQTSINDIEIIRNDLQPLLFNKEVVDKLIWEAYYKSEYDKLMSRLFNDNSKHCGIYKVPCLPSDIAYIGQSVDIKERFKQHIKNGLSYAPSSNKLYSEMQKYGCENFMFEILEEVSRDKLNEREVYWIDFYRTKEYGLNTLKGGA